MKKKLNCMICKNVCDGKLIIKDIGLLNKKGKVIEWVLCSNCFNLWANQDYDRLSERIRK